MTKIVLIIAICICNGIQALKLDRAIVSTDTNPTYIEFWPIVARAWKELIGVQPTLALIAPADVVVDETVGDVIRFEPLPGIPTALQAQVIRLLLPALFPDDGCVISDIDMIPINKKYFIDSVQNAPDNAFVVYRNKAYDAHAHRYPMCYNAARGSVFSEIFHITSREEIPDKIKQWHALNLGWATDELVLYRSLAQWPQQKTRIVRLNHGVERRIDRIDWNFDCTAATRKFYIDAHCLRPYHVYKKEIDTLLLALGVMTSKSQNGPQQPAIPPDRKKKHSSKKG